MGVRQEVCVHEIKARVHLRGHSRIQNRAESRGSQPHAEN
jgi:hypothetical protein